MALNVCADPAPLSSSNPYINPLTSAAGFTFIDDTPMTSGPCRWQSTVAPFPPGLAQLSNAWGNYGGPAGEATDDNSLMGCHAVLDAREYTDFLVSATILTQDNDGVGFTFGYKGANNYHTAVIINDAWPEVAADGIKGPFMKMKKRNARPCAGRMDASNHCTRAGLEPTAASLSLLLGCGPSCCCCCSLTARGLDLHTGRLRHVRLPARHDDQWAVDDDARPAEPAAARVRAQLHRVSRQRQQ